MTRHKKQQSGFFSVLRGIVSSIEIRKRHLFFWVVIALFMAGLVYAIQTIDSPLASPEEIQEDSGFDPTAVSVIDVVVARDGRVTVDGQPSAGLLQPLQRFDEFKYKVIDKPRTYIDYLTVKVTFQAGIPERAKIQSFAVHGIDQSSETRLDDRTIEYSAIGIGPEATYTVAAEIPKGTIQWPLWRRVVATISNLPPGVWLGVGSILPLLTLLILLIIFRLTIKSFFAGEPTGVIAALPHRLPPAIVGIIVHGRVSSREIAATLLDLANRGYLTIFNKGNGEFSFAKRAPWQGLQPFELHLLTQMFPSQGYKVNQEEVELSLGGSLFSRTIAKVYLSMYDAATAAGYFERNPAAVHARFRFIGYTLFFLGLMLFAATLLLEIQPAYLVFLFAGMMTMALVIIFFATSAPLLTKQGEAERLSWQQFGNYLADSTLVGYTEGAQAYYEQFLPYAVVLRQEIAWTRRFREHPFRMPEWYDTKKETLAIEDFASGLDEIVGSVGELFASAKEPTVH